MPSRPARPGARAAAVSLLALTALSACGLKPEVREQLVQGGTTPDGTTVLDGSATGDGAAVDENGVPLAGAPGTVDGGVVGGAPGTTGTGGGGGAQGSTGTSNGTTTTTSGGGQVRGTTTGIDSKNKVVRIMLHGPLTGAGVPQSSFNTGGPKYWNGKTLKNGYRVEVEALDDEYNAADAARVCAAAAKSSFLVAAVAGTDQISACAQQPAMRRGNVPYLASGVTEAGLDRAPNYFASSLTYRQQAPLIVRMARDNGYLSKKWAVVITGTPNFTDARRAIVSELKKANAQGSVGPFDEGRDVFLTEKAPSNCATLAGQLRGGGYESIYFLGQPAFFAQCVGAVGGNPVYTGPGPSFGLNTVANLACNASSNRYRGYFLHPTPGLETAAQRAPGVRFADDIEYGIYAQMQMVHQALDKVTGPLSREALLAANAKTSLPGGVLSPVSYASSRFGGTAAFALGSQCGGTPQTNVYRTVATYKR